MSSLFGKPLAILQKVHFLVQTQIINRIAGGRQNDAKPETDACEQEPYNWHSSAPTFVSQLRIAGLNDS